MVNAQSRAEVRRNLLAQREAFALHSDFAVAQTSLGAFLQQVLRQLTPRCLGMYWPLRGEFDAFECVRAMEISGILFALPFAQRQPVQMHYRDCTDRTPDVRDECGIPSVQGTMVVPDTVLVPCVGYTRSGHRLGYGAGYFDRWLSAHPHVTAIGVAWSCTEIPTTDWEPQSHDKALAFIVNEHGVLHCD